MFILEDAFTKEMAVNLDGASSDILTLLDPDDKPTWNRERIHVMMQHRKRERTSAFSSKVYNLSPSNEAMGRFLCVREVVNGLFDSEDGIAEDPIPHKELVK